MGLRDRGVFRARFTVSAEILASPAVELWFGRINGGGSVFLNGRKIGDTADARAASVYDVKAMLHPGENTIAVPLMNWGVAGGLNQGVGLRLQGTLPPVQWQRSAFNGLAQVIIQSTQNPGTIKLTASSPGLSPATLAIATSAASLRAALP